MIILGIDPGSITTGYAFLDTDGKNPKVLEYGVLHASESKPLEDRLLHILTELEKLLDDKVAALMLTNPNALGLFEKNIFYTRITGN